MPTSSNSERFSSQDTVQPQGSLATWFFVALLILLATLGTNSPWINISTQYVTCFFLFWIIAFFVFTEIDRAKHHRALVAIPLTAWLWIFFLLWGALGYFYSVRPEVSFPFSAKYLGAILLLLTLLTFFQRMSQVRLTLWILLGLATTHGILSLIFQFLKPDIRLLGASLFSHNNFFGDYLIFPMAGGAYLFLTEHSPKHKWIAWSLLAFLMIHAFFSSSRGTLLASALLVGILALGLWSLAKKRDALLICLTLVVGFAGYQIISQVFFLWMGQPLGTTLYKADGTLHPLSVNAISKNSSLNSILLRFTIWSGAWKIFTLFPVTGSGPWTFKLVYPFQDLHYLYFVKNPDFIKPVLPHHAHNLFLQTASDMGIPGLGLLIGGIVLWFKQLWRLFQSHIPEVSLASLFLAAGLSSYLFHNIFEYCWPSPVFIYTLVLWLSITLMISRQYPSETCVEPNSSRLASVFGKTSAVVSLGVLIALYNYNSALEEVHSLKNPPNTRMEYAHKATTFCPSCDWPYLHLANISIEALEATGDKRWAGRAQDQLDEAGKRSPFNPQREFIQGLLFEVQGKYSDALRHYLNAYRTGRMYRDVWTAFKRIRKKRLEGKPPGLP